MRLNSATLASHADQVGPAPQTWGRNAWRARLKLNEAALAGYEWWDREISLKTLRKFWRSGKHQEQSSPSLPPFCYYSNLKSLFFCCFVIDVYNGLLKSRVTNARMVHVTFVRPDFDSMNGEALIWTSAVSSPSSDTLNMPGYTLAASDTKPRAPLAFLLRLNAATLASHADQAGPGPRTWGRNAWRARLKLNEAALAGYEWWDREISLKTLRKFWRSGKHQEQSSPSLPPFCYYSNLKSLFFCCFVIDVYNGLLKSRVTNARMVHVTFVRPDFDSMNGEALIWTSAVSSPSSDTLNMPGYTLAASDKESIDPKYLCNSCGSLLREAMQTACGHFFCRSCLGNLVM